MGRYGADLTFLRPFFVFRYACSKFNLRQLVSADKIIPRGMGGAAARGSSMHGSPNTGVKKEAASGKRAGSKAGPAVHAMVYKQGAEHTERTSPPASDAIDDAIDDNSDGEDSFHSGSESAEEAEEKDKGAGALLALAQMAGRGQQ